MNHKTIRHLQEFSFVLPALIMFALFILSMIPILILYISLQKYIISGITSGAVKG